MLYFPREDGQGLVEYALILMLIAIVVIIAVALLGTSVLRLYDLIETGFSGAANP